MLAVISWAGRHPLRLSITAGRCPTMSARAPKLDADDPGGPGHDTGTMVIPKWDGVSVVVHSRAFLFARARRLSGPATTRALLQSVESRIRARVGRGRSISFHHVEGPTFASRHRARTPDGGLFHVNAQTTPGGECC